MAFIFFTENTVASFVEDMSNLPNLTHLHQKKLHRYFNLTYRGYLSRDAPISAPMLSVFLCIFLYNFSESSPNF